MMGTHHIKIFGEPDDHSTEEPLVSWGGLWAKQVKIGKLLKKRSTGGE